MEMASLSADRVLLLGPLQVIQNGPNCPCRPRARSGRSLLISRWRRGQSPAKSCASCFGTSPMTRKASCAGAFPSYGRWSTGPTTNAAHRRPQAGLDRHQFARHRCPSLARSTQKTLTGGSPKDLQSLMSIVPWRLSRGPFVDRAPSFENWLAGQRHRFGQLRQQLLERLSAVLPPESDDRIEVLRECIEIAPFDEAVHIELVRTLLRRGLYAEAERQIDASVARFQSEGIDSASLKCRFAAARRSHFQAGRNVVWSRSRVSTLRPTNRRCTRGGPTLLVMPFTAATPEDVADADSVTSDIIFGFAKLRSISVIARGTAFSLRSQTPAAAAALVNAQYVASGHLRRDGKKYVVSVELTDPESDRIFWADELQLQRRRLLFACLPCWPRGSSRVLMRKFTSSSATVRC